MSDITSITAVVLAGGRSSRMAGCNKATMTFWGEPLLRRICERLSPQVDFLYVNGKVELGKLLPGDTVVIPDCISGYPGPLVGLFSTFQYLDKLSSAATAVVLVPCDGPFLPVNLVTRLQDAMARDKTNIACVRYGGEIQPTYSLWCRSMADEVAKELLENKFGGFKGLLKRNKTAYVDWPVCETNPFFNINTPEERVEARSMLEIKPCL